MEEFAAWLIDALVGMGSKKIALRLQEIRRELPRAVAIEEGKLVLKQGTGTPCSAALATTRRQQTRFLNFIAEEVIE